MYSAAATGWIIYHATPPVVSAYLAVTSEIKIKNFKARQHELIEDWGRNVRHGAMGEELEENDDAQDQQEAEPEPESNSAESVKFS